MTEIGPDEAAQPAALQRLMAGVPAGRGPAPVHLWNPPHCGRIDMRIGRDGTWHYNGSPIGRPAMVRLFATILRKDGDEYVLVTPVERVAITVDDAPFLGVELAREADDAGVERLFVRTNLDDVVEIGADHPIRFVIAEDGGLKPYIHIRGDLWALATRASTQEIVALCSVEPGTNGSPAMFGLRVGPSFFPVAPAADIGAS